jgi:hypothetical protein
MNDIRESKPPDDTDVLVLIPTADLYLVSRRAAAAKGIPVRALRDQALEGARTAPKLLPFCAGPGWSG